MMRVLVTMNPWYELKKRPGESWDPEGMNNAQAVTIGMVGMSSLKHSAPF